MPDNQGSALHLKQTTAFVNENPSAIQLIRETKVKTPAGGIKTQNAAPLTPVVMRLVAINRVGATTQRTTPDGRLVIPTHNLVGTPPIDIQEGDKFNLDGKDYEVISVNSRPAWRINAEVMEFRA